MLNIFFYKIKIISFLVVVFSIFFASPSLSSELLKESVEKETNFSLSVYWDNTALYDVFLTNLPAFLEKQDFLSLSACNKRLRSGLIRKYNLQKFRIKVFFKYFKDFNTKLAPELLSYKVHVDDENFESDLLNYFQKTEYLSFVLHPKFLKEENLVYKGLRSLKSLNIISKGWVVEINDIQNFGNLPVLQSLILTSIVQLENAIPFYMPGLPIITELTLQNSNVEKTGLIQRGVHISKVMIYY